MTSRKSTRGASPRTNSAIVSISSGSAAIIRTDTPSGASRCASHAAFVFGTSPDTISLPIVRIEAFAIRARSYALRRSAPGTGGRG